MFTADHQRAADELLRVCRPGGVIAMANWTPGGFIGQVFKTIGAHVPPPPGVTSPAMWGTENYLRVLFGAGVSALRTRSRTFVFRYRSPQHFLEFLRTNYGPMLKAFEVLDDTGREALAGDLHTDDRGEHDDRHARHPVRVPRGCGDAYGLIAPTGPL